MSLEKFDLDSDGALRYNLCMSQRHSVQSHMGTAAVDYDRFIRTVIPGYEQMLSTINWWLSEIIPPTGKVVELGGGTGALAHTVLTNLPEVRLEIWDIDPQMLAVARERLQKFADRVTVREQSFTEKLDDCNAVIATLSLHHLPALDAKRAVYTNVFKAMSKPGIFLIGDCTMDLTEPGHSTMERYWTAFMGRHGITEAEAHKHFSDWAKEDTYQQIFDELTTLAQAGFPRPEVFWKEGPMAVYGGIKA
jgi:SAM-dependent methyltransferase